MHKERIRFAVSAAYVWIAMVAFEFETGHWVRLTMSAVTATLAFAAFLRFHTERALEVHR
ncbi:hypothetical protein [Amycolatopsis cihanbeyliensis]|uniref:Uncharacterized protein n=1 Tax=Amycolatopsis cihanbeyliensis TaxID=1128664 RepID=A0A542DK66_AMYCI|nr:hypothetical protein [Amycolatopsis cihanbeyliensis]TQJ03489.1 hypothetical protein FB471_3251 [Amycolatopsis cihanbeyliensis]